MENQKFEITLKDNFKDEVEAISEKDALAKFACKMDKDVTLYFKATPVADNK